MERFFNNFAVALAMSVLEAWERVCQNEPGNALSTHPALCEGVIAAHGVFKFQDEALYSQRLFPHPHGEVWQFAGDVS